MMARKTAGFPLPTKLPAYKVGIHLIVLCPYCGSYHYHGAGIDGDAYGGRVAHCWHPGSPYHHREYELIPADGPLPPEPKDADRRRRWWSGSLHADVVKRAIERGYMILSPKPSIVATREYLRHCELTTQVRRGIWLRRSRIEVIANWSFASNKRVSADEQRHFQEMLPQRYPEISRVEVWTDWIRFRVDTFDHEKALAVLDEVVETVLR